MNALLEMLLLMNDPFPKVNVLTELPHLLMSKYKLQIEPQQITPLSKNKQTNRTLLKRPLLYSPHQMI